MITNPHNIQPGHAFRLGSKWCLCTRVKLHDWGWGGYQETIHFDYHNGIKIVNGLIDACSDRIKPISKKIFRAHEIKHGRTSWTGRKFWLKDGKNPRPTEMTYLKEWVVYAEDPEKMVNELTGLIDKAKDLGYTRTKLSFTHDASPSGDRNQIKASFLAYP